MTFGEHLEELRSRILHSLIGVGVVFVIAFWQQDRLMQYFLRPYNEARESIRERLAETSVKDPTRFLDEKNTERRAWLVIQLLARSAFKSGDLQGLDEAHLAALGLKLDGTLRPATGLGHDIGPLQAIGSTEQFLSYIKVCLLASLLVAAPMVLYQMWRFIGAGLYQHERKVIMKVLPFSLGMFAVGIAFGYFLLVPVALDFLLSYGNPDLIQSHVTVQSYLNMLFLLLLLMGAVFQVPLVMTVLTWIGLVGPKTFREKRKFFILGGFIASAIITPPDYVTQVMVATPMVLLFELGILLSVLAEKRRSAQTLADDAAPKD